MKAKCAGVKLFRPLGIGNDGSYMVNATDCGQDWLRFHQQRLRTLYAKVYGAKFGSYCISPKGRYLSYPEIPPRFLFGIAACCTFTPRNLPVFFEAGFDCGL